MADIARYPQTGLSRSFRWRDAHGTWHLVQEMETRHLFYTVRMVWNHTVDSSFQLRPFTRYAFGPTYTPAYMKEAVHRMVHELYHRTDLTPSWVADLNYMRSVMKTALLPSARREHV